MTANNESTSWQHQGTAEKCSKALIPKSGHLDGTKFGKRITGFSPGRVPFLESCPFWKTIGQSGPRKVLFLRLFLLVQFVMLQATKCYDKQQSYS